MLTLGHDLSVRNGHTVVIYMVNTIVKAFTMFETAVHGLVLILANTDADGNISS